MEKQIGKEVDLLFTNPVGMPFWGLGEHESLIIDLFVSVVSRRNWRGYWKIKGSDCSYGTARAFDLK